MLTGVVEVGLFCHMAQAAYFGNAVRSSFASPLPPLRSIFEIHSALFCLRQDGSVTIKWHDGRVEQVKGTEVEPPNGDASSQ